jgi:hypothetical protein
MRVDSVEIFSDQTNAAIMRHPGRNFPGVLIQGDTLYNLCRQADLACSEVARGQPQYEELNDLRNALWSYLNHYKATLLQHGMKLPFYEV